MQLEEFNQAVQEIEKLTIGSTNEYLCFTFGNEAGAYEANKQVRQAFDDYKKDFSHPDGRDITVDYVLSLPGFGTAFRTPKDGGKALIVRVNGGEARHIATKALGKPVFSRQFP